MFELRETGDWDIFLGPPEWARAETGAAHQWVLKRREFPGAAIVNEKKTPASLGYHQFSIKTLFSKSSLFPFHLGFKSLIQNTKGRLSYASVTPREDFGRMFISSLGTYITSFDII